MPTFRSSALRARASYFIAARAGSATSNLILASSDPPRASGGSVRLPRSIRASGQPCAPEPLDQVVAAAQAAELALGAAAGLEVADLLARDDQGPERRRPVGERACASSGGERDGAAAFVGAGGVRRAANGSRRRPENAERQPDADQGREFVFESMMILSRRAGNRVKASLADSTAGSRVERLTRPDAQPAPGRRLAERRGMVSGRARSREAGTSRSSVALNRTFTGIFTSPAFG